LPLKLLLKFEAERPVKLSHLKPKVAHGIVFSFFKDSPEVGELLHSGGIKPFSISINSHFRYPEREVKRFGIVFNLLDNSLYPKISRFFLGGGEFSVGGVKVELSWVKPLEVETYSSLLEGAEPSQDILIDFLSPTAFKRGSFDYPLPEPQLVFLGLLRKWNRFSPVKLDREIYKKLQKLLTVSGCWIKTKKVEVMEGAKFTGFTGRVLFYADGKEEELRALNALAAFARFAGVGRKTTMGFGSVKLVKE